MEKPADTTYPVHDLIRIRWSPRAFADRRVQSDDLRSLLEAARWAPSCYNEQPWSFLLATIDDHDAYERILACLTDRNRRWAQRAPVLMISVATLTFSETGQPNRHAFHDVGLAVENLVIQATALGLVVHQMAGMFPDLVKAEFNLPPHHEAVAAIALGYHGDPASLPEQLHRRELAKRTRKPLSAFVFTETWASPSPIV